MSQALVLGPYVLLIYIPSLGDPIQPILWLQVLPILTTPHFLQTYELL